MSDCSYRLAHFLCSSFNVSDIFEDYQDQIFLKYTRFHPMLSTVQNGDLATLQVAIVDIWINHHLIVFDDIIKFWRSVYLRSILRKQQQSVKQNRNLRDSEDIDYY